MEVRESRILLEQKTSKIGPLKTIKGTVFTLPVSLLLQGGTAWCQERFTQLVISPLGESESVWMSTWLPQLCETLTEKPISFSSHLWYYWVVKCMTWGWTVLLRQQQPGLGMERIKGTWILLIALGTLSGSSPMSHWGCLPAGPCNWPKGTSKFRVPHPNTPSPPGCLPVHALEGMLSVSLCRWLVSTPRKSAWFCGIERNHILEHSSP